MRERESVVQMKTTVQALQDDDPARCCCASQRQQQQQQQIREPSIPNSSSSSNNINNMTESERHRYLEVKMGKKLSLPICAEKKTSELGFLWLA